MGFEHDPGLRDDYLSSSLESSDLSLKKKKKNKPEACTKQVDYSPCKLANSAATSGAITVSVPTGLGSWETLRNSCCGSSITCWSGPLVMVAVASGGRHTYVQGRHNRLGSCVHAPSKGLGSCGGRRSGRRRVVLLTQSGALPRCCLPDRWQHLGHLQLLPCKSLRRRLLLSLGFELRSHLDNLLKSQTTNQDGERGQDIPIYDGLNKVKITMQEMSEGPRVRWVKMDNTPMPEFICVPCRCDGRLPYEKKTRSQSLRNDQMI